MNPLIAKAPVWSASPSHSSERRTQTVICGFGEEGVLGGRGFHTVLTSFISLVSRTHRHPKASLTWLHPILRTCRQKILPGPGSLLSPRTEVRPSVGIWETEWWKASGIPRGDKRFCWIHFTVLEPDMLRINSSVPSYIK